MQEQASGTMALMDKEWADRISSHTLKSLYNLRLNKNDELPVTTDLIHLSKGLEERTKTCMMEMKESPSQSPGKMLMEALLARKILSNKQRGGEASGMRLCDFDKIQNPGDTNDIYFDCLNDKEKNCLWSISCCKSLGKRGNMFRSC